MKKTWMLTTALIYLLSACSVSPSTPEATDSPVVTDPPQAELPATEAPTEAPEMEASMPFELTSPAFTAGGTIPEEYSCKGQDISPELNWGDPPSGTQSLALIMDDPDAPAGTWVHWVLFNIPVESHGLPQNISPDAALEDSSLSGSNSWRNFGYGGPCPPSGTHRYFFKLYALDTLLGLETGATKAKLEDAMDGHILAETELMGVFSK
jgi:Raf kinase inhibitor-like YbhB/YbcL family protein